ncbi:glycosyltransferase [Porphyromonas macacae]|uniref:Spore coat polysaccharide biosynthesis protein spsA n=1 Tax=Porphyromonas macacae TaxID=28115 RepID=A0A379DFT8_9PORP|nr:glycosyltransferase [Porphyromonas macacae]SUB77216.1 Spore coat polysaccharide biosynthesis protein spsA [Porphyromonas macacae]
MSKLAVIMSIYKSDTLYATKQSIQSILEQTFSDFDFFIMYDGPIADDIDSFLSKLNDHRLKIYKRNQNKGLAFSLNELLSIILNNGYEFIARMDADDYSLPTRFEEQILFLQNNIEIDVCGSYIKEMKDLNQLLNIVKYPMNHIKCLKYIGYRNPLAHPVVMFRSSFFNKAGMYPTDTLRDEDTGLWLNGFLAGCKFANLPKVLLYMRISEDFFERRIGKEKSLADYEKRKEVIKKLHLPRKFFLINYFRYLLFRYSSSRILHFTYKLR